MAELRRLVHSLTDTDRETGAADVFAALPPLTTPRLLLRPVRMRDAEDFFAYASDPEVSRYVLWHVHRSLGDSKAALRTLIRQYRDGEPSTYGIVLRETGRLVGTIGFTNYWPEVRAAEVGYSLARPLWNRGLATEALRAMLGLCFGVLRLHRVEAIHDTQNPASGRVMQHCGMTMEGVLRSRVLNQNEWRDVCLYAILEDEWRRDASLHPQL